MPCSLRSSGRSEVPAPTLSTVTVVLINWVTNGWKGVGWHIKDQKKYQCESSVHKSKRGDDTKNVLTVGFPIVGEKVGAFEGRFEGVAVAGFAVVGLGVDLLKDDGKQSIL